MMLSIFTLALDSEPFIRYHLPVFEKLSFHWRWIIVHGRARNTGSTRWCKEIPPRLSEDGTKEYLDSIKGHPNVTVLEKPDWVGGKDEMVNAALEQFDEEGVLLQVDSDEIWGVEQLDRIAQTFGELPYLGAMQFRCEYHVGPDIVVRGDGCYGSQWYEWMRAWKFSPGMRAIRHEPPEMPRIGIVMGRDQTADLGLTFRHFAYATRKQALFKRDYYGYSDAVDGWERLQSNTQWPAKLKDYFSWVDDKVTAEKIPSL